MKRFIVALTVALASTAALAQTGKPFEQLDIDRALPEIVVGERTRLAAAQSETRSDAEIAVDVATEEQATLSPFANDQHFVAPPQ